MSFVDVYQVVIMLPFIESGIWDWIVLVDPCLSFITYVMQSDKADDIAYCLMDHSQH